MKFKLITVTVFALLLSHTMRGQGKWETGYIITNTKDTVQGYIEEMDSRHNAKKCNFKSDPDAPVQVYGPEDILGYRFTDSRFYISKTLEGHDDTTPKFMEFLIHGKLNVYHLKDNESRFFVEKEGVLHELKNSNEIVKVENVPYHREKKEYVGVLNYLLFDGGMLAEVQKSELNAQSLIKIAKEYHEKVCTTEQCIIYEKVSSPLKLRFGFHAGLSLSKIDFGGMSGSDFSMSPMLGCRIEFENFFEWSERFSLVLNMNIHHYTVYNLHEMDYSWGSHIMQDGEAYFLTPNEFATNGVQSLDVNIKTTALRVPLLVNYTFTRNKFMPYIGAGISTMYILNQNADFVYRRMHSEFDRSIPGFHFGFIGNVGTKFLFNNQKGFYLECRYENTSTLNINQILRYRDTTIAGVFGFIL